jgi:hypothetical protein
VASQEEASRVAFSSIQLLALLLFALLCVALLYEFIIPHGFQFSDFDINIGRHLIIRDRYSFRVKTEQKVKIPLHGN